MPSLLAHARFAEHFHACAFVNDVAEERQVIDPFLLDAARYGQTAKYIVDPMQRDEREARLLSLGAERELLEVIPWSNAYLKGGTFDPDRMMTDLDRMISEHAATGRPPMRLVGQMGWAFSSPPGIEELVTYETNVNELLCRSRTPTVCVYDVRRLNGALMMDLLRVHPLTVMNGLLHENPFYTPPEAMLRELQLRSAAN